MLWRRHDALRTKERIAIFAAKFLQMPLRQKSNNKWPNFIANLCAVDFFCKGCQIHSKLQTIWVIFLCMFYWDDKIYMLLIRISLWNENQEHPICVILRKKKVCLPALFCIRGLAKFGIKIQFILSGTRALKYF